MEEFFEKNEVNTEELNKESYTDPIDKTDETAAEPISEEPMAQNNSTDYSEPVYSSENYGTTQTNYNIPTQNKINYSDVLPINDYKPMSRGLKIFALIMAAVILFTGATATGYYIGRSSIGTTGRKKVEVSLAAKPAKTDEMTAAQVYDKVNDSVVGITVYNTAGDGSQASGVIYSNDGYIITNDHIYAEVGAPKFKVYTADGNEYEAKYIAGDQVSDLAVIKIEGKNFTPAEFGNSDDIIHGENVVAIGRPSSADTDSSITKGIISSVARRVRTTSNYSAKLIQTDSAINPGSSGGALVNMYGQVIGITSSKLAGVDYDAVGYAIPTKTMKRICEELIAKGKIVSRAKLGITYTAINSVTAEINNYDRTGLYVASVSEDSDLFGKLKANDIITHINGIEVTSDEIVLDIIEDSSAGDKISITVYTQKGSTVDMDAVLKANVGESSYSDEIKLDNNENNQNGDSSDSDGGTFNFPFGE